MNRQAEDANRLQIVARTGHPDFLDLPWHLPLAKWKSERLVEVPRGIHRHVVRFVAYGERLYALKELAVRLAEREYRLLQALREESVPVVEVVGVVSGRDTSPPGSADPGRPLDAVLITRHLEFSLPYRTLFTGHVVPNLRGQLLDALVQLLARLHLVGFFWGDCSLSNTLFRRDAGGLAAYLVDSETGELHPPLSDGQRAHDLMIAEENIAGDLADLEAGGLLPEELDPFEVASEVGPRYRSLWSELTREEVFTLDARYRIDARLQRLNDLGFDVSEVRLEEAPEGYRLKLEPHVVEPGHHARRLQSLTGLEVQENQARRLLNDMLSYRAQLERTEGRVLPESVVAYRWLSQVFEPTIAAIPPELSGKLEPAEVFHQVLEHRWFLFEKAGRDVGLAETVRSYIDNVLRFQPEERKVIPELSGEIELPLVDEPSEG
ncbi:MAG TPA: DUF4032 domain-containing protein [Candidatus Acidoferrum sp.]|nr:DUF4032 domain-containing protein [Candidatus Acidoferrum sp.]